MPAGPGRRAQAGRRGHGHTARGCHKQPAGRSRREARWGRDARRPGPRLPLGHLRRGERRGPARPRRPRTPRRAEPGALPPAPCACSPPAAPGSAAAARRRPRARVRTRTPPPPPHIVPAASDPPRSPRPAPSAGRAAVTRGRLPRGAGARKVPPALRPRRAAVPASGRGAGVGLRLPPRPALCGSSGGAAGAAAGPLSSPGPGGGNPAV